MFKRLKCCFSCFGKVRASSLSAVTGHISFCGKLHVSLNTHSSIYCIIVFLFVLLFSLIKLFFFITEETKAGR
ncbi:hypothetical protein XENTR_v10020325 [Xenopus tropicalis]|nr:hypothetical protein XENTR_v10020325 [Xenopus tropicalis]